MKKEEKIHGSIFVLLKNFVEQNYNKEAWLKLILEAKVERTVYDQRANYPVKEMHSLITQASQLAGISENELTETFGQYLVPDLLKTYQKYVDPSWKTYEMLAYTEHIMHKAVRKEESEAQPPVLSVSRVHDKLLIIDYYSERKLGYLAIGIIKGIAIHYNEQYKVHVIPSASMNESRVQIRIEFD